MAAEIRKSAESGETIGRLYTAAIEGSVDTLATLLKTDPLILDRVSLTSFSETPLHIAALCGHLEFTRALLRHRPALAAELDGQRCSALHLAAANGHAQVVRLLLDAYRDACSVRDREGRIPLRLAAMRGRVEVLREMLLLEPLASESLGQKLNGDSVMHLCVKYDQLEALKLLLVKSLDNNELLSSTDSNGNTILHLAVMLKQKETVKLLLSIPKMRGGVNALNANNFTPLDLMDQTSPRDYMSLEIRDLLGEAGAKSNSSGPTKPPSPSLIENESENGNGNKNILPGNKFLRRFHSIRRGLQNYKGEWMKENRGNLMTVITLVAAITFQAAIAPPGGVWQVDTTDGKCKDINQKRNITCTAGEAILAYYYEDDFMIFLVADSISFMGSLIVLLFLISGFPTQYRPCLWLMMVVIGITVASLGFTFMSGMVLVLPDTTINTLRTYLQTFVRIWEGSVVIFAIINFVVMMFWIVRLVGRFCKKSYRSCCSRRGARAHLEASVA